MACPPSQRPLGTPVHLGSEGIESAAFGARCNWCRGVPGRGSPGPEKGDVRFDLEHRDLEHRWASFFSILREVRHVPWDGWGKLAGDGRGLPIRILGGLATNNRPEESRSGIHR